MKRLLPIFLIAGACFGADAVPATPLKPKLLLAVVVDQFRYDYILKFRADYTSGLKRILDTGAVFHDAHHIAYPTVTAVGHSTFLTGATPSMSGIVANEWYERETKRQVTSVVDFDSKLVGGKAGDSGSSPKRLLVSTVGDEIKMSGQKSKVIGISIKDRGAVLPAGHMADAAYWFDAGLNVWTTSTYYMPDLPGWVAALNAAKPAKRSENQTWFPLDAKPGAKPFCTLDPAKTDIKKCRSLEASPWGNEVIEEMAEKALVEEKLGQHEGTDVLTVSFSSNDYVGHELGPDDPAVRDISIRTDRLLGKLFAQVEKSVGMQNVIFVLTADHGVAPVPEVQAARKMNGGRISDSDIARAISDALTAKYGAGAWLQTRSGSTPYLNLDLIESKKLNLAEVEKTAAEAAKKMPHIFRTYTKEQLLTGDYPKDPVSDMVANGFFPSRVADLAVISEPYYLFGTGRETSGTTHGSPFEYDSHVPIIFMGKAVKPGHYYGRIAVNDIAPTLSAIVGVLAPSGSVGRVLTEMLK